VLVGGEPVLAINPVKGQRVAVSASTFTEGLG
jgi:hypothetical protein